MNKPQYKELLNDICDENCNNEECILKQFLVSAHPSPRLLIQLKCVDRYKRLCENLDCKKMTWAEAMERWVKNGRAIKFAEAYDENKKYLDIYKEVMEDDK